MAKVLSLKDHWPELVASLPDGFDMNGTARALGAFIRSWEVKDPATLLRLALAYGGCGMSLRQTCAWAAETGLARLSDPALLMAAGRKAWRALPITAVISPLRIVAMCGRGTFAR